VGSATNIMSPPMTTFPLSMQAGGGLGTVGLTKTVLEVEGILEVEATNPSPILSGGLFWTDSIWVSISSVSLSICNYSSNRFSSRSMIFNNIVFLSVLKLFSSCT
jgi:hypothetical protein